MRGLICFNKSRFVFLAVILDQGCVVGLPKKLRKFGSKSSSSPYRHFIYKAELCRTTKELTGPLFFGLFVELGKLNLEGAILKPLSHCFPSTVESVGERRCR